MGEGMTLAGAQRIIELENEIADLRRQLATADPHHRTLNPRHHDGVQSIKGVRGRSPSLRHSLLQHPFRQAERVRRSILPDSEDVEVVALRHNRCFGGWR